jgi:AcrR family transcriptional regulator
VTASDTSPAASRGPRWHRRKQARPAEILAAALSMFVERGYAATKLEDVARRAGVTKGTMYLYFDSKETLFKAVVAEALVGNIVRGERLLEEHRSSASELLARILQAWVDSMSGSPASGIPKLMIAEANNFPELGRFYLDEVVRRSQRLLGRVIQMGVDRGEFRPMNVEQAVHLVVAPILLGFAMNHSLYACTGEEVDMREALKLHLDVFLRGIAARPVAEVPHA